MRHKTSVWISLCLIISLYFIVVECHKQTSKSGSKTDDFNKKILTQLDANKDGTLSKSELQQLSSMIFDELKKVIKQKVREEFAAESQTAEAARELETAAEMFLEQRRGVIDEVVNESLEKYGFGGKVPADMVHKIEASMRAKLGYGDGNKATSEEHDKHHKTEL